MRGILLAILIVIVAVVAYNYWGSGRSPFSDRSTVGTTGTIDAQKVRERGAELGEKAADAANKVGETVSEAATTAKIKAKMALDDTVKSRTIDVSTSGTTVTLRGTVRTEAERNRAVALAREASGVSRVVDHLAVRPNEQ
jgi:osmotically-inducible protein OsmY